jgi:hypothetical protein
MHPEGYDQVWAELPTLLFIPLTQGKFAVVDSSAWDLVRDSKWHAARIDRRIYANKSVGKGIPKVYMHRAIAQPSKGVEVDHRNGDGLDNRFKNLRLATRSQNEANKPPRGRTGFKGVSYDSRSRRYAAYVGHDKKWVGTFATAVEAAVARDVAAKEMFGEFAYLNFPDLVSQ